MKNPFDKVIDRRGTGSVKYDGLKEHFGREDLIPLWVADMDFKSPDCVSEALERRFEHSIYGYAQAPDSFWNAVIKWKHDLNGWDFTKEEMVFVPGIVRGISYAIQTFTQPGDRILIQPPVYMPFSWVPQRNGRVVVHNQLVYNHGIYEMDFTDLEWKIDSERPVMMILSNPQNPSGRCWSKETLSRVADICHKYGVIVVSDEIHSDMVLYDNVFTPFAMASEIAREISVSFAAPSKTFNIAGIQSSYAVVHNTELRNRFFGYIKANELDMPSIPAIVATEAAFTGGHDWLRQMLAYIQDNVDYVSDYIGVNIPGIYAVKPDASFLVWLNCNRLGLNHEQLIDLFVNRAHLALNDGEDFGPGGEGFMRLNVGCPRSVLRKAMEQLKAAVEEYKKEQI